ncbi:MAG: GDSL-type esterase/lipase family protein [Asticcacaulis sp.]|nr:GDSL-type esterase/lipase family protein [Asticcacaulis sp.]
MWKTIATAIVLTASATAASASNTPHPPAKDIALPVHVGGRAFKIPHEYSNGATYSYQWPAVYFESRFTGDAVTAKFADKANNFNIIVDNKLLMVVNKPGLTNITLDRLGPGEHTIRVEKRSETQYAEGSFLGFYIANDSGAEKRILTAPVRARQIEFIGDSLTVGYGNTSAFSQCTPEEIFETTDSQQGFGPLTAKHFNADYEINAFSGLGMVRNYDGREHPKYHMPMLYKRVLYDIVEGDHPFMASGMYLPGNPNTPPSGPDWHPQVIVIGIGGNDFSTPVRPDEPWGNEANLRADYVKTYTAFVKTIRDRNPDAFILLATPPDRQEGYTGGTDDVFAAIKATGDTKIDRVTLPELDKIGCNGHPSTRADARVADFYIQYLTNHPQVWQGK